MGDKGGFPLVSVFDMHIVVPPLHIKFGEYFCSLEFINEVGNERERIGILNCVFIEIAIVLAWLEPTIFLLHKEERGCLGRA